jgi:hypothetical protein
MNSAIIGVVLTLVGSGMLGCRTHADELPPLPVTPAQTKVLILPTLDETGDRAEMQREHVVVSNHRLEYELMTRGFQVMGPQTALRAARTEDIDLDDSDGRGANSLKALGKDTGADWVLSAAVIEVHEDRTNGIPILFTNRRAYAKVQIKIYDIGQGGYIVNRFEQQHKTTIRVIPGPNGIGTTGLFKDALDTTVQRSVANVLAPYPQMEHIDGEFDEDDLIDQPGQVLQAGSVPLAPLSNPSPVTTAVTNPPIAQPAASTPAPATTAAPSKPAPAASAAPAPTPATTRFVKKNGDVIVGVIDHHDMANGVYFVKVPTGMTAVRDDDITSMTTVDSPRNGGTTQ